MSGHRVAEAEELINTGPIEINGVLVEPEFAEAFDMKAARIVVTADDESWVDAAAAAFTGFGTSVIACGLETAIERRLAPAATPDGRPGVLIAGYAMSGGDLEKQFATRLGQCVLTCPTASAFSDRDVAAAVDGRAVPLGSVVRYFGDGHQISKVTGGRRFWRVPVMDGEFVVEHDTPRRSGIGGGNFLILGRDRSAVTAAARRAVAAIADVPDVVTPFPGGVARSGSKVGSKYPKSFASTNDAFCPTLRGVSGERLADDEHCVLEIVLDGLSFDAISAAIHAGIHAACTGECVDRLTRITAGNYGGKLGRHHFHLHDVLRGV